jgi:diadenosine tetraphosphatase ApaH/serine/threonine PP2A family protein phosphatase
MRIALLADIHANREALEACLAHARSRGAGRFVFLGDYVGYGADPAWTVATVMAHVEQGAVAVLGNHDHAVADTSETMTEAARIAMQWTRGELAAAARQFLAALPASAADEDRLYRHAAGTPPKRWTYVRDRDDARQSMGTSAARVTLMGHTHVPALFGQAASGKMDHLRPTSGVAVPLLPRRRWVAVLGSVGQPRDGNPAAAYALLDTATAEIVFERVPYDVDAAAAKIRRAGLPESLAARLARGR